MGRTDVSTDVAAGVKRRLRSVTRASASSGLCHVLPIKKPRRGFDGKFVRPIGKPPVEGFVWDAVRGFWVPRGTRRDLESPSKYPDTSSSSSSSEEESDSDEELERQMARRAGARALEVEEKEEEKKIHSNHSISESRRLIENLPYATSRGEGRGTNKLNDLDHSESDGMNVDDDEEDEESDEEEESVEDESLGDERVDFIEEMSESRRSEDVQQESLEDVEEFNPNSIWQEPVPEYGSVLTLYDRHRKPREVPSGTYKCSLKLLQQEFRCVICLGYIRNAKVVKECLHRFCEDCIEKALLQVGRRNECPICRIFLASRRNLESDPNFDQLIKCILKNIAAEEEERESIEYNENQVTASPATILQQAIRMKRRAVIEQRRNEQSGDALTDTKGDQIGSEGEAVNSISAAFATEEMKVPSQPLVPAPKVKLVLRLHEKEKKLEELEHPFLTISGDATVKVLRHFLQEKLGNKGLQLFTPVREGKETIYKDWKTLQEIAVAAAGKVGDDFPGDAYIPIYYRIAPIENKTEKN